jgi:hypothetical protein
MSTAAAPDAAVPEGSTWWTSRTLRKGLDRPGVPRRTWWIAILFSIGSLCFTVGPTAWWLDLVGPRWDGMTFFIGSIFFTSASYLCFAEVANSPDHIDEDRVRTGRFKLVSWHPRSIDWWATIVQLVGTVYFNATTLFALHENWSVHQVDRLVWRPDAIGSICFLVSSYLAWAEVRHASGSLEFGNVSWWIVVINLLGSIFFGLSAIGEYVLPSTGDSFNAALDNAGTVLGGVCFLVGAILLIPEARRRVTSSA